MPLHKMLCQLFACHRWNVRRSICMPLTGVTRHPTERAFSADPLPIAANPSFDGAAVAYGGVATRCDTPPDGKMVACGGLATTLRNLPKVARHKRVDTHLRASH